MNQKGLTLLEVLVALALLSVLLTLSIGIFSRFVVSQRREASERALQEDVRFSLELLLREARTAFSSSFAFCQRGCQVAPDEMIVFRNQNGQCVAYRRANDALERAEKSASGECENETFNSFEALTSRKTRLTRLRFVIPEGILVNNTLARQGFITVVIAADSTAAAIPPLQFQTTVTSRQIKSFNDL